jgi:hypothetical protein
MREEEKGIIRDTYKNLTAIEDLHLVKQFVVDREQAKKSKILTTGTIESLYKAYEKRLSNPELKEAFAEYYAESSNTKKQNIVLTNHLVKFHFINAKVLSKGDEAFAKMIMNEKYMKDACEIVANDLLNGKIDPLSHLAAKQAENIRKELEAIHIENKSLRDVNSELKNKNISLVNTLNNLVNNIKAKFSLTDSEIKKLKDSIGEISQSKNSLKL